MNPCPPFVTIGVIAKLCDDKHSVTVHRWRKTGELPAPDVIPDLGGPDSKRALWSLDTIIEWAAERGQTLNADVLRQVRDSVPTL